MVLTGTSTEELLKFASALRPPVVRLHLCGEGYDQRRTNPDLIHLQKFCQLRPGDEKTWEDNLKETDKNAELRRQQAEWERQRDAGEEDQETRGTWTNKVFHQSCLNTPGTT